MSSTKTGFKFKLRDSMNLEQLVSLLLDVAPNGLVPVDDKITGVEAPNNGKVVESTPAAMSVDIYDLFALSGGEMLGSTQIEDAVKKTLSISAADPTNPRIDLIVIEQETDRALARQSEGIKYSVIAGTPAVNPVPPAKGSSDQVVLAHVTVDAGATSISNAKIDLSAAEWVQKGTGQEADFLRWALANDAAVAFGRNVDVSAVPAGAPGVDLQLKIADTDGTPNLLRKDSNYVEVSWASATATVNGGSSPQQVLIPAGGIGTFNYQNSAAEVVNLTLTGTAPKNLVLDGNPDLNMSDVLEVTTV